MSEDLHNIDDLFKKGLEDHSEYPPASVWENIDKNLDKKKVISISKKYYKLKWAAAVLLLFSIGMAMYTLHVSKRNKELVKQNNEKSLLKRAGSHIKNSLNDSQSLVNNNRSINKKEAGNLQSQKEDSNTSLIRENNKLILPANKSTPGNLNSNGIKKRVPPTNLLVNNASSNSTGKTMTPDKNTADNGDANGVTQQMESANSAPFINTDSNRKYQKQVLVKQKPGMKMQSEASETGSVNNEKNENRPLNNSNEIKGANKGLQNSSNASIALTREQNIEGTAILRSLTDVTIMSYAKPHLKMATVLNDNFITLKGDKGKHVKFNLKSGKEPAMSATIFFSPDVVSTNLKNEDIHYSEEDKREIEKAEKNNFSTTTGVLLDYKISNKLQLESGITFSSWVTKIEPKTIYARPDSRGNVNYRFNCSAGYSYLTVNSAPAPAAGDSLKALGSNNTLQYIGVPLILKYNIVKNRFSIVPGIGLYANFLTRGQIKTTIATNTGNVKASASTIDGLRPMYFSGVANISLEYSLSKTFSFAFIPGTRFSLSSINKNAPVKTNLYYFGFGAGVIIKL